MADRYVVAAGGSWNSTGTWSTSDGGAGGASVPTASDNVYLTSNSGNLNVNATATCLDFDCAGYTGTLSGSSAQTISGTTFRLSAGMTCSRSGALTFNATSGTCQITSAGKTITTSSITFNGAGGTWALQDDLSAGANTTITITNGAFVSNGYAIAAAGLSSSNSNVRTVDIAGSTMTLGGSSPINFTTITNLTFDASGSEIYFTGTTGNVTFSSGSLTYGDLHLPPRSGGLPVLLSFNGTVSFNSVQIQPPCTIIIQSGITIATPLVIVGDAANLIVFVLSGSILQTITVPTGDSTFEWCAFAGISFSGTGSFTATNSYNLGGNAGITISPPSGGGASPEDIATAVWGAAPAVINANIKQVNSVVIAGDGDLTPWGPA